MEENNKNEQFNSILNELNRPRLTSDTIAIIQFCVNVGILPDGYKSELIVKKQPPYVPPQVQQAPQVQQTQQEAGV